MIQDALGWCTGMTQRDGMGREVGGGFRMGNTCTPLVNSCSDQISRSVMSDSATHDVGICQNQYNIVK